MNILRNPLYLLNASIRDDKLKLVDLADDYALLNDDDKGHTYANDLTSPRSRLSIEMAWLVGVDKNLLNDLIDKIEDFQFIIEANYLNPLAKANLLSSSMKQQGVLSNEDVAKLIFSLSLSSSQIKEHEIKSLINEERVHSKFTPVDSIEDVSLELKVRKKFYKDAAIYLLGNLPSIDLVDTITKIVDRVTNKGESYCPSLVKDLVSFYELKVQNFLGLEEENINKVIDLIDSELSKEASSQLISIHMSELIRTVISWDSVAQPMKLLTMSQCIYNEKSNRFAHKIRELNLRLFEHDYVELAQKLNYELADIFSEDYGFKESLEQEFTGVIDFVNNRSRSKEEAKKFSESFTYKVDIGFALKRRFIITPEKIEWKERSVLISDITRIRWGDVKSRCGTEYRIYYGNDSAIEDVITNDRHIFLSIIERIWRTAGLKIIFQYLTLLKNGDKIEVGDTIIKDQGIVLGKHKLLGKTEYELVGWHQIQLQAYNGNLVVSKTGDPKMNSELSYLYGDNVHVIESMINMTIHACSGRLSDVLLLTVGVGKNIDIPKGFNGVSKLVSVVETGMKPISKPSQKNNPIGSSMAELQPLQKMQESTSGESDFPTDSGLKVEVTALDDQAEPKTSGISLGYLLLPLLIIGLVMFRLVDHDTAPKYSTPNEKASNSTTSYEPLYIKPSVGINNVLAVSQIRWCVRESIRIEAMRNAFDTNDGINKFHSIVNDYNGRCGSYRYREGALSRAQREVEDYRTQIVSQAVREAKLIDQRYLSSSKLLPSDGSAISSPDKPINQFIREVQKLLTDLGYNPGPIDGEFGDRTAAAVEEFQRDIGVNQDGKVDYNLLIKMRDLTNKATKILKQK